MRAPAIGPALDFVLLQPHRQTNEHDLPSIGALSDPEVTVRIAGPAIQKLPQVHLVHIARHGLERKGKLTDWVVHSGRGNLPQLSR